MEDEEQVQVSKIAFGLGILFGVSLMAIFLTESTQLSIFLCFMSLFHFSEYFICALYRPLECTSAAFLIHHSLEYQVAFMASLTEFVLESYLFPQWKVASQNWIIMTTMLALASFLLRIMAQQTAGHHFSHQVRNQKEPGHELVDWGVYRLFRHPSYTGFFYYSLSLQCLLLNPICFIGYGVALVKFFSGRIRYEESFLIQFFGSKYREYRDGAFVLIPMIE